MRTAIFGGSFDPPHVAHVLAAHYVLSIGEVDRVVVVPVYQHAFDKNLSSFGSRVKMCEAAFEEESRIIVSQIEASLPRPNYTLNTVKALRAEFPRDEFRLVMGADVLDETKHWHRFDEVAKFAPPLVLGRAGIDSSDAPRALLPEVSSTEARRWFRESANRDDRLHRSLLIPARVRDEIATARLYR